jgi:chromate transporter
LFFLKVGSVLFGSGYVLLAFLRADLVERWGWLTLQQLLDAIAVGQFTPGPLFTTATFVGYLLAGPSGAVLATAGIFAPGFVFVALTAPFVDDLRHSTVFSSLLDGVVLASLGLMGAVAVFLAVETLVTPARVALCGAALLVLWWRRPNTAWLVAAGAALGWLLRGVL